MNLKKNPKILIISDATWADNNNIGATFSNLFQGYPKENLAMIYARPDLPSTKVCDNFFQISENRLMNNLFNKSVKTGLRVGNNQSSNEKIENLIKSEKNGKKMYQIFHKFRFHSILFAREILWKVSNWKTEELNQFIAEFNPDIVLSLACPGAYMSDIQQYVIDYSNAKSVVYFVDDIYSLRHYSFSPFFWINKQMVRKKIKKTVKLSETVYTIIPKQKREYDQYFDIDSVILNKGGFFNKSYPNSDRGNKPLNMVYTGNVYAGRWETIIKLGETLDKINENEKVCLLSVYTTNKLTSKMKKDLAKLNSIRFMGAIPANEVSSIQQQSDILLHVESMKLKEKLSTRLSFSTKLVDYFAQGKPILAIGWKKAASIEYLRGNDVAAIVDDLNDIDMIVGNLVNDTKRMEELGANAVAFGKRNHSLDKIQENFIFKLSSML